MAFYVRAKPNDCTLDHTIKYITRYLGRPVIAASRIDDYDGENVTFHYNRHEDESLVTETVPALDFIKRLIVHIPEKHFKMVRYSGIYEKHHKQEKHLFKYLSNEKRRFLKPLVDWRKSILLTFGYDPLKCAKCGASMSVLEVYHKKTALFEQYRKQMGFGSYQTPYYFSNRQIMQFEPKTKNLTNKVIAKYSLRSFVVPFFISKLLDTIYSDLRSSLII